MRTLFIVPMLLAIVLTGCKAPEPIDLNVACRDRKTNLNHLSHKSISIDDPTIYMCRGRTLTIKVVPPVAAGGAGSMTPNQTPGWLNKSTNDNSDIVIDVPQDGVNVGDEFKYTLTVTGEGSLDPIIRIIN